MSKLLRELWNRHVPQILMIYLGAGWGVVEFSDWLARLDLASGAWTDTGLVLVPILIPAVLTIAWVRGQDPGRRVTRAELGVVPVNIVAAVLLIRAMGGASAISTTQVSTIASDPTEPQRITFLETGLITSLVFSPDGQHLAFLSQDTVGVTLIAVRVDGSGPPDTLAQADVGLLLRWQDSSGPSFWTTRESPEGVARVRVGPDGQLTEGCPAGTCSYSPDGTMFAGAQGGQYFGSRFWISMVEPDGGESLLKWVDLSEPAHNTSDLAWSPAGPLVAVVRGGWVDERGVGQQRIDVVHVDTEKDWYFASGDRVAHPRWSPDGRTLDYVVGTRGEAGTVWRWIRREVDPETGQPTGPESVVGEPLEGLDAPAFDISPSSGWIAYAQTVHFGMMLGWAPIEGASDTPDFNWVNQLGVWQKTAVSMSPDGSRLAFYDSSNRGHISFLELATGAISTRPLPQGVDTVHLPAARIAWSPSGTRLLATIWGGNPVYVVMLDVEGPAPPTLVSSEAGPSVVWCTDDVVLYQVAGNQDFVVMDIRAGTSRRLLGDHDDGWVFTPRCSPDGDKVAMYFNNIPDGPGVYALDLESVASTRLVDVTDTWVVQWSGDGEWIYYMPIIGWPRWILRVPAAGGTPMPYLRVPGYSEHVTISKDGSVVAVIDRRQTQDLWAGPVPIPGDPNGSGG